MRKRILPPPPPGWPSWEALMEPALEQAAKAGAEGEVPVGAVLVDGHGTLLAMCGNRVEHRHDPTAHAEIETLRQACAALGNHRLEGCVLIVTLEPCLMCAGALIHARLAGVVYGCADPAAGAIVSQCESLDAPFANHRLWHLGGIRERECADLLTTFFAKRRPQ